MTERELAMKRVDSWHTYWDAKELLWPLIEWIDKHGGERSRWEGKQFLVRVLARLSQRMSECWHDEHEVQQ